jgi:hypothetical protein
MVSQLFPIFHYICSNYAFGTITLLGQLPLYFLFIALSIQCSENGQHSFNMLHYTCNLIHIYIYYCYYYYYYYILLILLLYALAVLDYID